MFAIVANNRFLTLSPDSFPILEKAAARFGSIESREGLKSVDFEAPFSISNFEALGFAIRPGVRGISPSVGPTPSPFSRIPARIEDSGQIISIGFLQIYRVNWSEETISITFFGDSAGWFSDLDGKTLRTLNLSTYNHVWNKANIIAGQSRTDGYFYPLIDYGSYADQPAAGPLQTIIEDWLPSFYIHTLVVRIFDEIGYKVAGSYLNSPRFSREILAFSLDAMRKSPQQRKFGDLNGYADFFSDTYDSPDAVTDTTYLNISALAPSLSFTAIQDIAQLNISLNFGIFTEAIRSNFPTGTISVGVEILKNSTLILTNNPIVSYIGNGTDSNNNTVFLQGTTSVIAGDAITFRLVFNTSGLTVGSSAASLQVDLTNIIFTADTSELIYPGDLIDIAYNLPDFGQAEFLLDIAVRHGLIFYTDSATKTVNFYTFSDIIARKAIDPLDWSDRLTLNEIRELNYSELTENYGRRSWLKFAEDGSDSDLNTYRDKYGQGLGDGFLTIKNQWLPAEEDIYTSIFAATAMTFAKDGQFYVAKIPHYETDSTDFENTIAAVQRVLLAVPDLNYLSFSRAIRVFLEGSDLGDNIGWAYFTKGPFRQSVSSLSIDRIIDGESFLNPITSPPDNTQSAYQREYFFLEKILNDSRYLRVSMRLYSHEFQQLDFSRPVFLSTDGFAGYYLVERIEGYANAQTLCDVYLIGV